MGLNLIPQEPVADVIDALEELLEEAKKGELRGLIYVGSLQNGFCTQGTVLGDGAYIVTLLGQLRILEREYIDNCVDLTCRSAGLVQE